MLHLKYCNTITDLVSMVATGCTNILEYNVLLCITSPPVVSLETKYAVVLSG